MTQLLFKNALINATGLFSSQWTKTLNNFDKHLCSPVSCLGTLARRVNVIT